MNKLTEKQLINLNEKIASQNGVIPSVRNNDILKEVVDAPYVQDEEFFYIYKNKIDMAAVLGIEITQKKPFANNNIATATLAMLTFLQINGKKISAEQEDIYHLHDLFNEGDRTKVVKWIKSHR